MAANTINTALLPIVTGMFVRALEPLVPGLEKYNTDYSQPQGAHLGYIRVPKPDESAQTARTVAPGVTSAAAGGKTPEYTELRFQKDGTNSKWIEFPFDLDDWEKQSLSPNYLQAQANAVAQQFAIDMERRMLRLATAGAGRAVSRFDAGAGAAAPPDTLFGPAVAGAGAKARPLPLSPITRISEILAVSWSPMGNRCIILDEATYFGLAAQPEFQRADWTGQTDVDRTGALGAKLGLTWLVTNGSQPAADQSAGAKMVDHGAGYPAGHAGAIHLDGGGTLVAGDVVAFGNGTHSYVVSANVAGGDQDVTLRGPLREAISDNDPVTVVSRNRNLGLAMHRDFFLFATRALDPVPGESMVARIGPVNVRVVMERQSNQVQWKVQTNYVGAVHRPQLGIVVAQ